MAGPDVVVVGGGIGGLTCAAFLAKQGIDVTLFERDDRVGGLARSVPVGDRLIPANLGRIDGLAEGDPKARILGHLGVLDGLRATPAAHACEVRVDDGFRLAIPAGLDAARETLLGAFPEEARGVQRALGALERASAEIEKLADDSRGAILRILGYPLFYPTLFRLRGRTLGDFLRAKVRSPRARTALGALVPLFGTSAEEIGATTYGIAATAFLRRPVVLPGGGRRLAGMLSEAARSAGAEVRTGVPVDEVLTDGRSALGVRTPKGEVRSKMVVANAPALVTFASLVPRAAVYAGYLQRIGQMRPSGSACVLLLAVRAPRSELDAAADLVFVHAGDDPRGHAQAIEEDAVAGRTIAVAIHPPADGDPGDVTLLTAVVADRAVRWSSLDDDARAALAAETERSLRARLAFLHPDWAGRIEAARLLTPLDLAGWSGDPEGSLHGWEPTPGQSGAGRLEPRTPVDRLVLAGAWTSPGGGYGGTMLSGFLAGLQAATLLGKRVKM